MNSPISYMFLILPLIGCIVTALSSYILITQNVHQRLTLWEGTKHFTNHGIFTKPMLPFPIIPR